MRISFRNLAVAGALALAACGDSAGPSPAGPGFDTRRVKDGLATVEAVGANPVLRSFGALGGQIGASAAAAPGADRLLGVIRDVAGIVRPETQAALVPIIRSGSLGKTLVWDAAAKKYVVSTRGGAPANGVRFVLYEQDPNGQPNPAKEIGAADLTDEKAASPTAAGLRLKVTANGTTYLDYAFDLSGSLAAAQVNVAGYMSDGTHRVDFQIATSGQLFGRGGTATIDATLKVTAENFTIHAKATGPAGGATGETTVDLTVTAGNDVVAVTGKTTAAAVTATVTVNGKTFATVTGTAANPVIKGEGGRDLTADELAALGEVFKFTTGAFELVGGLLAPAGALLLIGLGL